MPATPFLALTRTLGAVGPRGTGGVVSSAQPPDGNGDADPLQPPVIRRITRRWDSMWVNSHDESHRSVTAREGPRYRGGRRNALSLPFGLPPAFGHPPTGLVPPAAATTTETAGGRSASSPLSSLSISTRADVSVSGAPPAPALPSARAQPGTAGELFTATTPTTTTGGAPSTRTDPARIYGESPHRLSSRQSPRVSRQSTGASTASLDSLFFSHPAAEGGIADLLPRRLLSGPSAHALACEGSTCAICLEGYGPGEEVACMPCGGLHKAHWKCLREWLARSPTCPSCRWDLGESARGFARFGNCTHRGAMRELMARGEAELQRIRALPLRGKTGAAPPHRQAAGAHVPPASIGGDTGGPQKPAAGAPDLVGTPASLPDGISAGPSASISAGIPASISGATSFDPIGSGACPPPLRRG